MLPQSTMERRLNKLKKVTFFKFFRHIASEESEVKHFVKNRKKIELRSFIRLPFP